MLSAFIDALSKRSLNQPCARASGTWLRRPASPAAAAFSPTRRKVLADAIRDFKLSGIALPEDQKARYKVIALRPVRGVARETPGLLAVKLVIHPMMVWAAMTWVGGFDPVWVYTAVLMAAIPVPLCLITAAALLLQTTPARQSIC